LTCETLPAEFILGEIIAPSFALFSAIGYSWLGRFGDRSGCKVETLRVGIWMVKGGNFLLFMFLGISLRSWTEASSEFDLDEKDDVRLLFIFLKFKLQ